MLFHVINDRYRKKRAKILTTHKPLSVWGRLLHDDDLADAIVDRILERCRMLTLDGLSMRTPSTSDLTTQTDALLEYAVDNGPCESSAAQDCVL